MDEPPEDDVDKGFEVDKSFEDVFEDGVLELAMWEECWFVP